MLLEIYKCLGEKRLSFEAYDWIGVTLVKIQKS